ncbi:polysaccharide deacetylase family protein [Lactobacillus sp. CC-MHH1034]|uniref:polysaccharide deacetylase family protein n=1 Tax=Agrilactobacillus fermenti TaxID=2586909 RepID=UPI001E2C6B94|nr:polysaccharide deacetylase family protein [Agrilactobacillus fermenti]MCD2256520.1 polysaccharide deacetylase family protein [Agrilactobacillus fermenti]
MLSSPFVDEQVVLGNYDGEMPNDYIEVNGIRYAQVDGGFISDDDLMKNLQPIQHGDIYNKIPVLAYHRIAQNEFERDNSFWSYTLSVGKFKDDMAWLADNDYHTLTESEAIDILLGRTTAPDKSVLVTFDDFYGGWIGTGGLEDTTGIDQTGVNCVDIMTKYGINAIFFLITGNNQISDEEWTILGNLDHNQFALGAHTVTHPAISQLTNDEIYDQISDSKATIESRTGATVRTFAYPGGDRNDIARLALRKTGYELAFNFGFLHNDTRRTVPDTELTESITDGSLSSYNLNRKEVRPDNAWTLPDVLTNDHTPKES